MQKKSQKQSDRTSWWNEQYMVEQLLHNHVQARVTFVLWLSGCRSRRREWRALCGCRSCFRFHWLLLLLLLCRPGARQRRRRRSARGRSCGSCGRMGVGEVRDALGRPVLFVVEHGRRAVLGRLEQTCVQEICYCILVFTYPYVLYHMIAHA